MTETQKLVFALCYRSSEISFPASSTNLKSFEIFEIGWETTKLEVRNDFTICVKILQYFALNPVSELCWLPTPKILIEFGCSQYQNKSRVCALENGVLYSKIHRLSSAWELEEKTEIRWGHFLAISRHKSQNRKLMITFLILVGFQKFQNIWGWLKKPGN